MRYSLQTLLVVMLLGGPIGAWCYIGYEAWQAQPSNQGKIKIIQNTGRIKGPSLKRLKSVTAPSSADETNQSQSKTEN